MWNFFARESFPYEISAKDDNFVGYSVFSLHQSTRKNSGDIFTVFSYNVKGGNSAGLENARTTIKKLKTLKHPSILTYVDSYEDENVIHLVTNHVVPLFTYLKKLTNEEVGEFYLKWGLATICEAVAFLNEYNLRHNNIFHGAVFIDDTGSWKLGEVGYISNTNAPYPHKVVENLTKYNPHNNIQSVSCGADYWGLGVLTWEVFNGELNNADNLLKPRKIPSGLASNFLELTKKSALKQEVISAFIQRCTSNNLLCSTLEILQNYHLKDKDVKAKVSKDLLALLPSLPKDVLLHKMLQLLKQAYEFDSENSAFLVPVISKIPSFITEEEFQNNVEHFFMTLFSSNDRATRLALLMNIEEIINKINKKSINDLFPYVSTGFLDSNPKIRGETVKALFHFAPKLSKKHLNDDALRNLLQIQTKDPEPYIRTNTTICLGKVAHCLHPESRKKILITAFLHSLRDPYPAVRNAGVQAFAVTHRFFPLDMIARNVLPGLVCLTIDPDDAVRRNAFKTIKVLFAKMEKFSESPDLREELEKDVMSQTCENNSSWSGWAFAAITSKFLKPSDSKMKPNNPDQSTNKNNQDVSTVSPKDSIAPEKVEVTENDKKVHRDYNEEHSEEDTSDWENDGWGDAHEEVLQPVETLPTPNQEIKRTPRQPNSRQTEKKISVGPMKLGTRINKQY